jgi:hypothetical protein
MGRNPLFVQLTIDMPPETRDRVRSAAEKRKVGIKAWVLNALLNALDAQKRSRPRKAKAKAEGGEA